MTSDNASEVTARLRAFVFGHEVDLWRILRDREDFEATLGGADEAGRRTAVKSWCTCGALIDNDGTRDTVDGIDRDTWPSMEAHRLEALLALLSSLEPSSEETASALFDACNRLPGRRYRAAYELGMGMRSFLLALREAGLTVLPRAEGSAP